MKHCAHRTALPPKKTPLVITQEQNLPYKIITVSKSSCSASTHKRTHTHTLTAEEVTSCAFLLSLTCQERKGIRPAAVCVCVCVCVRFLTSSDGVLLLGVEFLHLGSPAQLKPASVSFSGLPQLLEQQRLLVVPQRTQTFSSPPRSSYPAAPLQTPDHVAQDVRVGSILVERVTLERLFDQFLRAGPRRGQNALVVGTGTDFVSKNLQDPGGRALCGEFRRVICRSLWGFSRRAPVPTSVCSSFYWDTVSVAQSTVQHLVNRQAILNVLSLHHRQ